MHKQCLTPIVLTTVKHAVWSKGRDLHVVLLCFSYSLIKINRRNSFNFLCLFYLALWVCVSVYMDTHVPWLM